MDLRKRVGDGSGMGMRLAALLLALGGWGAVESLDAADPFAELVLKPAMLGQSLGGVAESEESDVPADKAPEAAPETSEAAAETPAEGATAEQEEAKTEDEKPPVFQMSITGSAWFASLSGQLQTSKGGGAGTTSWERPTLQEIGLDGLNVLPTVDARFLFFGNHELHVNYAGVDISGSAVLGEELISQAVTFPAGSYVESGLELDLLRVGYRLHWLGLEWSGWALEPEIGFSMNPFRYTLTSPTVAGEVDRSYTIGFPYLGLLFEGPIVGALRGELEVTGSAGFNGAHFLDVDARLAYQFFEYERLTAAAVVGLRGTWLVREDSQSPQYNDIDVRIGSFSTTPWAGLTAGLRIGF